MVEAFGYGEGGGGEDDGGVLVEEGGGEEFGDVDGCGLEVGVEGGGGAGEAADSGGGAALDPEDGVGVGGFEKELEVVLDVGGAFAEAGGLVDVLEVFELAFEAGEGVECSGVGVAGLLEEGLALVEGHASGGGRAEGAFAGEGSEEEAGTLLERGAGVGDGAGEGVLGLEHGLDVAGELVDALGGEADAEVVGGDVFELVGLVEDDGGGFGEDAGVGGVGGLLLDGEIGEEEVVVDDDDVGLEGFATHGGDEAVLPVGAGLAEAGFGAGVEFGPKG